MSFVIRQLEQKQTLGQTLRCLRLAAKKTLSDMAEITKIRKCYLTAIEKNNFSALSEPLYAKNFIKTYVQALGADENYFLDRFEQERGTCDFLNASRLPMQKARPFQFFVIQRIAKIAVIVLLALCIGGYLTWQLHSITTPPSIVLYEPTDGASAKQATIKVTGQVEKEVRVQINGNNVLLTQEGIFETEVLLERGVNTIIIEAKKRYSRTQTVYRRVIMEHKQTTVSFAD